MSISTEPKLNFTSLRIWPPYGILPSFDPECLCALAHLSFSRLNIRSETKLSRMRFLKEHIPSLWGDNDQLCLAAGYEAIAIQCRKSHINIDDQNSIARADLLALETYVKLNLIPAVLETLWLDDAFRGSTINIYGRSLGGFPLAYIYGKRKTDTIRKQFNIIYGETNDDQQRKLIFEKGKKAIDHVAHILGNKPFLFGSSPTSIDALVFGYLAPLIHGPASNSGLARWATNHRNLVDFNKRILTVYLGELERESASPLPITNEDRLRDKIAVVAIGVLTMCAYAFLSGLIRVEINEVD